MNNLILSDIKYYSGIQPDDPSFDGELLINVMSGIGVVKQLGVDPSIFEVDSTTTWAAMYPSISPSVLALVKNYLALYVRRVFDASGSGTISNVLKQREDELTWRIMEEVEYNE